MAGSLHGSARTTPRIRAELQTSQETTGALARRYGLSRPPVANWRGRPPTNHAPMAPPDPRSTRRTPGEASPAPARRPRPLAPPRHLPRGPRRRR